ncbi:hypothetical protein [Mycobacterium camsae]|uniref:hypothetical protein n=1 Tax=Mycobacterium gordonae TaxID=1778 RepID=UPI001982389F|nr:hypothetical protein [Mycobacterium gordonae]
MRIFLQSHGADPIIGHPLTVITTWRPKPHFYRAFIPTIGGAPMLHPTLNAAWRVATAARLLIRTAATGDREFSEEYSERC